MWCMMVWVTTKGWKTTATNTHAPLSHPELFIEKMKNECESDMARIICSGFPCSGKIKVMG